VVLHQNKHLSDEHSQDKGKGFWVPDEIQGLKECTDSYFLVILKGVIKYQVTERKIKSLLDVAPLPSQ